MNTFEAPVMHIQKLDEEDFMKTSGCYQVHECIECYCGIVDCNSWSCSTHKCAVFRQQ